MTVKSLPFVAQTAGGVYNVVYIPKGDAQVGEARPLLYGRAEVLVHELGIPSSSVVSFDLCLHGMGERIPILIIFIYIFFFGDN